jgi:IS30 family transposase
MDFIEGLPLSNGFSVILVVVDRFTKYIHFVPIKHTYSASSIAQVFMDHIVKLHGIRKSIVCDRDKVFRSLFWTELFKLLKTDLKLSSAYHPQMDGQTEHVNQCLEMFLRCAVQATISRGPSGSHKLSYGTILLIMRL